MSFLGRLFGRNDRDRPRHLQHPQDLQSGDLLQVDDSFALPDLLRGQTLKVIAVNTTSFERSTATAFTLEGGTAERIGLTVEREEGRDHAAFSLAIQRHIVEAVFDMDEFAQIFDAAPATLESRPPPPQLAGWLAERYHRVVHAQRGYWFDGDYRQRPLPQAADAGEPFDYYCLHSDDEQRALEIEVWEGGETEISLTLYRPLTDIKELWPGA